MISTTERATIAEAADPVGVTRAPAILAGLPAAQDR